jgi:hypothetical protein
MRKGLLALGVLCCARVAAPVAEPQKPPQTAIHVPSGCTRDLSGEYTHADDPSYVYRARDDGGSLDLVAGRSFSDGGTGAPTIHLERGPDGFKGQTVALAALPSGGTCEVSFATSVKECPENGLVLESASSGSVGEGCQTPARPRNPVMLVHKLTRADAGAMRPTP